MVTEAFDSHRFACSENLRQPRKFPKIVVKIPTSPFLRMASPQNPNRKICLWLVTLHSASSKRRSIGTSTWPTVPALQATDNGTANPTLHISRQFGQVRRFDSDSNPRVIWRGFRLRRIVVRISSHCVSDFIGMHTWNNCPESGKTWAITYAKHSPDSAIYEDLILRSQTEAAGPFEHHQCLPIH